MSSNFWLTEEQFNKIKPLLPNKPRGVPRVDDRRVLSGTVGRLMRENSIAVRRNKTFKATTDSNHSFNIAPNLLDRDFFAERPNQKWAGAYIDAPQVRRTLAIDLKTLDQSTIVLLSAGPSKVNATHAILKAGFISGLVIDGDSALHLRTLIG